MSCSRSRLVAAIRRTSALIVAVPPTRSNSFSCSTRSSLICMAGERSPISSRKSVPPCASSKRPFAGGHRAGEGALLVAEELALDHALRQRRAIDLDDGLCGAPAGVVDGVRHQLLARAALPAQEHRRVARGDLGDEVVDLLHRLGVADDVRRPEPVLQLVLQPEVLLQQPLALLLRRLAQPHRLRDQRGDDGEQARVFLELDGASEAGRSALSAPITSRPILMGTQRKERSPPRCGLARAGLVEERGLLGDARNDGRACPSGSPCPVMPSPSL